MVARVGLGGPIISVVISDISNAVLVSAVWFCEKSDLSVTMVADLDLYSPGMEIKPKLQLFKKNTLQTDLNCVIRVYLIVSFSQRAFYGFVFDLALIFLLKQTTHNIFFTCIIYT